MKISIIVPIYNAEKWLCNTIESLLNQMYFDIEVICVDDGSTDESARIVDDYALKDSRVIPIHCKNGGVSRARNIGIEHASGDYVGFLDCDDMVLPTMFEKLIQTAISENADITEIGYVRVPDDFEISDASQLCFDKTLPGFNKNIVSFNPWQTFVVNHKRFSGGLYCPAWHRIYKADLVKKCYFLEGIQPGEDTFFSILAFLNAKKYVALNDAGLLYRQNNNSVSHGKWRKIVEKNLQGRAEIIRWFLNRSNAFKSESLKDIFKLVTREMVSWPLKTAKKSRTEDDRKWLRDQFVNLLKEGVLQYKNLPLSKRLKLFLFIRKYIEVLHE